MSLITFDPAAFRLQFPAFAANPPNTDAVLQGYFDLATVYISDQDGNCFMLTGKARVAALNFMTAHLAALFAMITAAGSGSSTATIGMEQSATIDKVSVSMTPPPSKTQFQWWLGLTPYGQMLLALLQGAVAGGLYVPGGRFSERAAFRKAGGSFA